MRARWSTGHQIDPEFVAPRFVALALDSYFRGDSQDVEFCNAAGAGGNKLIAATAGGRRLATKTPLRLLAGDLIPVLRAFEALPEAERRPALPDKALAAPPQRPLPAPPAGGLILRGYCSYAREDAHGRAAKSREYYYRKNPLHWAAETQTDTLWLTEAERRSLAPRDPAPGAEFAVPPAIARRVFGTIAVEYMAGSASALAPRDATMTARVESVREGRVRLRLDGAARLGKDFSPRARELKARGCAVRVLGFVEYDAETQAIDRFELVGLGRAWGNAAALLEDPWMYGIACELVPSRAPIDCVPPYNLLHYGSGLPYFETKP
jgi:hypothetical protein